MVKLQTIKEMISKVDTLTLDVPTFIRVMELAREDIKKDETIHEFTEKLLQLDSKLITMREYNQVVKTLKF